MIRKIKQFFKRVFVRFAYGRNLKCVCGYSFREHFPIYLELFDYTIYTCPEISSGFCPEVFLWRFLNFSRANGLFNGVRGNLEPRAKAEGVM